MEDRQDGHQDSSGQDDDSEIDDRLNQLWSREASPVDSPLGATVGQKLGHYKIRAYLGSGSFGIVYLADDTVNQRPVAIKLPRPEVLVDSDKRARFFNESEIVSQLDHPGIIKVFEAGIDGLTPFIATQWCNGPDLSVWLAERQRKKMALPTWQETAEFVAKLADAIHYAHQHGICHRDLKPANILLDYSLDQDADAAELSNYTPKVADFGLAKLADPILTATSSSLLVGTPVYMAPELIQGSESPHASKNDTADIYSLGVILFELLTGRSPIAGEGYFEVLKNIRSAPRTRLSAFRKDLPPQLEKICATCLSQKPSSTLRISGRFSK